LDEVVVYNQFTDADFRKIVRIELNKIKNKLSKKEITLSYTAGVVNLIVSLAKKENLGARPVQRILSDKIENMIAESILLEGSVPGKNIKLSKKGNCFLIK
jgi:ATP-dependent Clp protease ATP-binding subunit ClpA